MPVKITIASGTVYLTVSPGSDLKERKEKKRESGFGGESLAWPEWPLHPRVSSSQSRSDGGFAGL